MSKFYTFSATRNNGEPFPMENLKGKVVLIVNTASKCGFTKQYSELEALYKKYKDQGLEIIGFPCNQFAGQEPGSSEEIAEFCQINFGVTFPLMQKIDVNGDKADPIYEWLKSEKSGMLGFKAIKWNFEKFLVDKEGKVYQRYSSLKNPASISDDIEKLLKK
ncbi:peroxiredoxin [Pichia kluyveri]|uniref:Glutathione peroxidase n=1 Tax=Pichia kluyveri TaxID=36015 RepID=A0AAV5R994_PICKL|nr:peroxiredoxin [Pichia kluyveri]